MQSSPPSLMEPRGFFGTACFLGAITGLPFALLWTAWMALTQERPFAEVLPWGIGAGLFFGAFFGLAMAFFLRGETATVVVSDRKAFVGQLNVATSQIGFYPATQSEDFFTYKPGLQAGLAAGRISVQLQE